MMYRNLKALFTDDFDYFYNKEATQNELFYTLLTLKQNNAFLGIAVPEQFSLKERLSEKLYNYFTTGLTVEIPSSGREAKISKIHSLLLARDCFMPDSVINYLAEQNYSMPELTGIINKIVFYKNEKYIDITIEEAEKIITA